LSLASIIPLIVAVIAVSPVLFYTAKPQKDSIIAAASKSAVEVLSSTLDRQEQDIRELRSQLAAAHERIAVLRAEVTRLGGEVDEINRVGKQGPPGERGPQGPPGKLS
jgi:hypothetical protein